MTDEGAFVTAAENVGRGDMVWMDAETDRLLAPGYYRVEAVRVDVAETILTLWVNNARWDVTVGSVDDVLVRRLKT